MPARPPEPGAEWLPSGFPPRSFPRGEGALPRPVPPPRRDGDRGRGRWLALGALGVAVLVLAVGLLLANRNDDDTSTLATSTSTSLLDTSVPSFDSTTTPSTSVETTSSIDPVSTTVAGATTVPGRPAGAGNLEPSLFTVNLARTDASAGASRGPLVLRNLGGAAVTYTTSSSSPGLSAAPARGTIQPGGAANLTVTLDAARIASEGPFVGTLTFASDGAPKSVEVRSVTGRAPVIGEEAGEPCSQPATPCSRQIKLAPSTDPAPSPCNTPWLYAVTILDQSRISTSNAIARRGIANADAALRRVGTSNTYLSDGFTPLPEGTVLRFTIEAIDEHGFGRRLPEQTITC